MKIITKYIEQETAVALPTSTHRIVVIDCSGSMGSSLPKIRTALKNKIPTMVQPDDVLSIVWFSGRGQFGTLMEAVKISGLTDLSNINKNIDRYLSTVGMTAFVQPLEEVVALAKRVGMPATMFFMTDGCSTGGETKNQILTATANLAGVVSAATFVEFSYYADHELLSQMAEEVGGSLIQSSDFDRYVQQLEQDLSGSVAGGKRITVDIDTGVEYVVSPSKSGFIVAKVTDGKATLPAGTREYAYTTGAGEVASISDPSSALYLAASLVQRGKADQAMLIAEKLGDVDVYQSLQNAFSKQDYANAVDTMVEYANGSKQLYSTAPKNTKLKVKADAYNVLQLLMDLSASEGNFLHLSHPAFKYSSIGALMETTPDANGFVPEFESVETDVKAAIASIKFNEDRPNVSMLVRREGFVEVPKTPLLATTKIPTFIWRNYTIVKDGIINTQYLPLILTAKMHAKLVSDGILNESFVAGQTYVIDTKKMPIINRQMVENVSAEKLAELALEAYRLKCHQKVVNAKIKEEGLVGSKFVDIYGQEATDYLKEYGITESGFSPKETKVDGMDSYMAKELKVKLKGLSSIPKIDDVATAVVAKKALSVPLQFLKDGIDAVESHTDPVAYKKHLKEMLQDVSAAMVKIKFSVILGKKWFKEFATLDENATTLTGVYGKDILCTFDLTETEIK